MKVKASYYKPLLYQILGFRGTQLVVQQSHFQTAGTDLFPYLFCFNGGNHSFSERYRRLIPKMRLNDFLCLSCGHKLYIIPWVK